ncbi:MAG: hypothetical protein VW405_03045, partial [Rhodospirillaceae bacterium]
SYGRGEGGWIEDPQAPMGCRPYNDYDLLIVGGRRIGTSVLKDLERRFSEEFDLRWVDLKQKRPWELRVMPARIYTHDLRAGSCVIAGDPEILELVPDVDPARLSLREAETLFFTRLWTLTGGIESRYRCDGVSGEDARFFRNQMSKCILAAGDMILLQHGCYHASYAERVARLTAHADIADHAELFTWALNEKRRPAAKRMSAEEVSDLYAESAQLFMEWSVKSLELLYGRRVADIRELRALHRRDPRNRVIRLVRAVRSRSLRNERYMNVVWAQAHLVAQEVGRWKASGDRDLKYAADLLRKCGSEVTTDSGWDRLRAESAHLRMAV